VAESPFSAAEIADLEASLDDLDFAVDRQDLAPAVRERLGEYRDVLAVFAEGLPLAEVPEGLLDAVLGEAANPEVVVLAPGLASKKAPSPRRWLVPAFGALAAAALLLLVIRPQTLDMEPRAEGTVARHEAAPRPAAPAIRPPERPAGAVPPSPQAVAPAQEAPATPEAVGEDPSAKADARVARDAAPGEPEPQASSPSEVHRAAAGPTASSEELAKQEHAWAARLHEADAARERGDCATAEALYRALLESDEVTEARAHAGLGLCATEAGRNAAAAEHFERAQDLDADVSIYISREQSRLGTRFPPTKRSSNKGRTKAQKPTAIDEGNEARQAF